MQHSTPKPTAMGIKLSQPAPLKPLPTSPYHRNPQRKPITLCANGKYTPLPETMPL